MYNKIKVIIKRNEYLPKGSPDYNDIEEWWRHFENASTREFYYLYAGFQIVERLQLEGKTTILVSIADNVIGVVGLQDTPKPGAKEAISALKSLGIESIMLTGDNENTAKEIVLQ